MTVPDVGRCLGSGEAPRESSVERAGEHLTGVCVACSGRFEIRGGEIVEHESAPADQRESIGSKDHTSSHGDFPVSPARAQRPGGPTTEEEMRGAQPPNADPLGNPVVEHEARQTGNTAEVVDLDEVNETGAGRSAHPSHNP